MRISCALALLLVSSVARAEDLSPFGPHAVGVHRDQTEVADLDPNKGPRILDLVVWYPAAAAVPGTAATVDADVARGRFPLIVFSHGACSLPELSTTYTRGLATFGFVVVAPSHPGTLAGDCALDGVIDSYLHRVIEVQGAADWMLAQARDPSSPFYRHVDPRRLGVSGHSYGGQTTLRVLAADRRFLAGVALQPAPISGITIEQPLLVIGAERDSIVPFETASRPAFELGTGPRYLVEILDAGHCAVTDACCDFCGPDSLPPAESSRLGLRYAVPFFRAYVRGDRTALRDLLSPPEPGDAVILDEARLPRSAPLRVPGGEGRGLLPRR
jgi:predicted dienelactone hydrolase